MGLLTILLYGKRPARQGSKMGHVTQLFDQARRAGNPPILDFAPQFCYTRAT
jgi:phosphoribosylaminoimidazole carboxylase (NCAIR synthetase)